MESCNNRFFSVIFCLILSCFLSWSSVFAQTTNNRHRFSNEVFSGIELSRDTPSALLEPDLSIYKEIFDLQENARFDEANKKIDTLTNKVLLPYVLYQKYMHPKYKDTYAELKKWLDEYSDLPVAAHIYDLAVKRAGSSAGLKRPSSPKRNAYYAPEDVYSSGGMVLEGIYHLSGNNRATLKELITNFKWALRRGYTKNARQSLEDPRMKKLARTSDYYKMASHLAFRYFVDNDYDDLAIKFAKMAADNTNYYLANWVLGLVYFRRQDFENSKKYFKKMTENDGLSTWDAAAAAYWTYKANKKLSSDSENKEDGDKYLEIAASYNRTMYGMLASAQLGRSFDINWDIPEFTREFADKIIAWDAGVRAIALLQLGYLNKAAKEFRWLIFKNDDVDDDLIHAVMAFAEANHLPNITLGLAPYLKDSEGDILYPACLYPEIKVEPTSGWQIDRALIFALIRQESRFGMTAGSSAGALGLMQIMPNTASFLENDASLRKGAKYKLLNPEYNIALGQKYIQHLMSDSYIGNNLIKILIAYNAGPGRLRTLDREIKNPNNDPLFYLEALRIAETRIYVKRVLTNLWFYRSKFGQRIPSLKDLSNDKWPEYISID